MAVVFSDEVSAIDLPTRKPAYNAEADALGWGKETYEVDEDLINSEKPLKIVKLKTINKTYCKHLLPRYKKYITKKHICAKGTNEGENIYKVKKRS